MSSLLDDTWYSNDWSKGVATATSQYIDLLKSMWLEDLISRSSN